MFYSLKDFEFFIYWNSFARAAFEIWIFRGLYVFEKVLLLGSLFILTVDHRAIFELKVIIKFFKSTMTSCALDFTK